MMSKEPVQPCAATGCPEEGIYKAPLSRAEPGRYRYFCLSHIREFNQSWNFFDGWSREEIERFNTEALHGHRPTWRIGSQPRFATERLYERLLHWMEGGGPGDGASARPGEEPAMPRELRDAFSVLEMPVDADRETVKKRYKKLARLYHPDVNRQDVTAEDRFKRITAAYRTILKAFEAALL